MIKFLQIVLILLLLLFQQSLISAEIQIDLNSIIESAKNGESDSQARLGEIYLNGESGEIDFAKAYYWLKLSSNAGNPIGLYNLARLYESGLYVERDSLKAVELYTKSYKSIYELAQLDDIEAQVKLGNLLEIGAATTPDLTEALKWYKRAADLGSKHAQFILGYKYYYGWGYDQNYKKAFELISKAAIQGYATAQHFLGNMYTNGVGVKINYDEAIKYYKMSESFNTNNENFNEDSSIYTFNGISYPDDKIIPELLPPKYILQIEEGSCGEACIWSIVNSKKFHKTQLELNIDGGAPERGLYTNELHTVLECNNIEFIDNMNKSYFSYVVAFLNPVNIFSSDSEKYKTYLYENIIQKIKHGNPILLGIKIYPDKHTFWDSDHFILLVGYNEKTNEIIYNDFNKRKRIHADKLLNTEDGYSLINRYNFLNYIEFLDY